MGMGWKLKKIFCMVCALLMLGVSAAAADLFPMSVTQLDGETRWGYMDTSGTLQVGTFYAAAQVFEDCGLAVVQDVQGKTGLIGTDGKVVVSARETPLSVDFSADTAVFRYADHSVYFALDGTEIGSYAGAAGFFSAEGLLRAQKNGKWGYVDAAGEFVIPAIYPQAGDFSGGYALVQKTDGSYGFISTGAAFTKLPASPASFAVQADDLAILQESGKMALYSLSHRRHLTQAVYDSIGDFENGVAVVQEGEVLGLLSASGKESLAPQYYYLDAMGEGAYAIRDAAGASMAIDSSGARIYAMDGYTGGFAPFRFGLSWHGTADGGIVFFSDSGAYRGAIEAADTAEIVGAGVAKVQTAGETQYIRIADGKVLYTPKRSYTLDSGMTISTNRYEKYLGTAQDGTEYGWDLQYPVVSGMADEAVQQTINDTMEGFFLNGPSAVAQRLSLVGDYGVSFCGQVMVVNADAISGLGVGAMPWNDNIMVDLRTGATYSVTEDLLTSDAAQVLQQVLPQENPFYTYSAPLAKPNGIVYHVAHAQTAETAAYTDTYMVYFSELGDVLQTDGACYQAMTDIAVQAKTEAFSDVPTNFWGYAAIMAVSQQGWMTGYQGKFYPAATISACQAVASLSRALSLPDGRMDGIDPAAWYAGSYGGASEAGLLRGLESLNPLTPLTREQTMRLMANVLRKGGGELLDDMQIQTALQGFSDQNQLTADYREAAAYCVQAGVIQGTNGALHPKDTLTRAQFAVILRQLISA